MDWEDIYRVENILHQVFKGIADFLVQKTVLKITFVSSFTLEFALNGWEKCSLNSTQLALFRNNLLKADNSSFLLNGIEFSASMSLWSGTLSSSENAENMLKLLRRKISSDELVFRRDNKFNWLNF